jgi:hypothetical protein
MNTENHALDNASGWMTSIIEYVAAAGLDYDRLEELREEKAALVDYLGDCEEAYKFHDSDNTKSTPEWDNLKDARKALADWEEENAEELEQLEVEAGDNTDAEQARERLTESILDLQVRSDWHAPGEESEPTDFAILLSTGGPALRIRGELGRYNQPERAWLEYQDWGTPWTEYYGENLDTDALLAFAAYFYFGE